MLKDKIPLRLRLSSVCEFAKHMAPRVFISKEIDTMNFYYMHREVLLEALAKAPNQIRNIQSILKILSRVDHADCKELMAKLRELQPKLYVVK